MRWVWVWMALGCGGGGAEAPEVERPRDDPPRAARDAEVALDPAVVAAVGRVEETMVRGDLEQVAVPRHAVAAPDGLARVADYVAAEFAEAGLRVTRVPVEHQGVRADNIVGERLGTDPTRVIIVAAHYDAVAGTPGADDNATGVAAILAIARALAPVRSAAGLRFVAFAFEEDYLVGSAAYVAALPRGEEQRIEVAIALDMIGFRSRGPGSQRYPEGAAELLMLATGRRLPPEGDYIGWFALDDLRPGTRAAMREARRYVPSLSVFDLEMPREAVRQMPDLARGDHASFWARGIPAIAIGDTGDFRNPHYHQPTDTIETIDVAFATDVTRWLAAAVLLAAGPQPNAAH